MKRLLLCVILISSFLTSCSYNRVSLVEPTNPELPYNSLTTTDSLQPVFEWKPVTVSDITYDLVVYEGVVLPNTPATAPSLGREVYYKEGLRSAKHKIERPLRPKTIYAWSVRTRSGAETSSWSVFDRYAYAILAWSAQSNSFFPFKTPDM